MAREDGSEKAMAEARGREDDAQTQFLRLMSHEFRTPLNGVIGMLGLLSRTRLDGAQKAYVEAARSSADHLLGLVNDLLDYARMEAGHIDLEAQSLDLEALIQGAAELLSPRAHDKGIEIVWSCDQRLPRVLADEGRLRQVLYNLAGNAVKFTESGGVHIRAQARDAGPGAIVLKIMVDDTGPGVPRSARTRIFEEFGHVDPSDATAHGGAGLGLAVARRLVEAMGGEIGVADRPRARTDPQPRGARFWFEVPLARDASEAPATPEPTQPLQGATLSVVCSSPFLVTAIEALARSEGALIGEKADVALIDHETRREGEALARPADCPSIILLRPLDRDLIGRYRALGFRGYLIKPLRRASLSGRVLAALGRGAEPRATARDGEDDRVAPARPTGTRVLLAEDNPVGALLARTLLAREGCTVETAATGHEALQAMSRARYDIVLMDVRMPGMDGLEATRQLRARGDATPVIALTANAFVEDRQACLAAGMNEHLTKPLSPEALRSVIARFTNRELGVKLAS